MNIFLSSFFLYLSYICILFNFILLFQQAKVVGLDWVPMFWGTPHTNEFQQQLNAGAFSKCTAFLGFNEYVSPQKQSE